VAGNGNQLTVRLVRHSQRKRRATDRSNLRSVAPFPDPTRTLVVARLAQATMALILIAWLARSHFIFWMSLISKAFAPDGILGKHNLFAELEDVRPQSRPVHRLCRSKISKSLSGWELYFFHNSYRCSFLSQHSSQLCLRSPVRVLPPSHFRDTLTGNLEDTHAQWQYYLL